MPRQPDDSADQTTLTPLRLVPGYRQVDALRALRLNYTRKGVWVYLKGTQRSTNHRGW